MIKQLIGETLTEIIKWLKKVWFEARLTARLKMIELENQIEAERERDEHFKPLYSEKPVDTELQTGESAKLGGEMRLSARWNVSTDESDKTT